MFVSPSHNRAAVVRVVLKHLFWYLVLFLCHLSTIEQNWCIGTFWYFFMWVTFPQKATFWYFLVNFLESVLFGTSLIDNRAVVRRSSSVANHCEENRSEESATVVGAVQ